jgi:hypothetical protein
MNMRPFCAAFVLAALSVASVAVAIPEADSIVRNAESFAMGGVGFAGTMSAGERALRQVLKESDASSRLESMIPNATAAGKLYGLLGLRARDRAAYARALQMCRPIDTNVETVHGCVVGHESFRDVVQRIEHGDYDAPLKREWPAHTP